MTEQVHCDMVPLYYSALSSLNFTDCLQFFQHLFNAAHTSSHIRKCFIWSRTQFCSKWGGTVTCRRSFKATEGLAAVSPLAGVSDSDVSVDLIWQVWTDSLPTLVFVVWWSLERCSVKTWYCGRINLIQIFFHTISCWEENLFLFKSH